MANINPIQELVGFAIERIRSEQIPAVRKVKLLRAAALCVANEKESHALAALAEAIESTERQQKDLFAIYSRPDDGAPGKDGHDHNL